MILFSAGLEWPFLPQLPPQDNIYGLFDVTGQASINCRNLEGTYRFFG
jgi:hypothetical protein